MSRLAARKTSNGRPDAEDVRHVLDSLRRIVRVLRLASRDAEKRVGLSAAQLFVLQRVAEADALSINEVAERTHTHQSSVSVVVQRLVERGLVSRKRARHDARQIQLSVTAAGRAVLRSAPKAAQDRLIAGLERLTGGQVRELAESLRELVDSLGIDGAEPAAMLFEEEPETGRTRKNAARNGALKECVSEPADPRNRKR